MNTCDHTAGTTLTVVRFNPGMTPVIQGKLELEATAVSKVILDSGEMAMLLAPRHELGSVEVMDLLLTARETGKRFSCSDEGAYCTVSQWVPGYSALRMSA
ncbi:hypothetical protein RIdsm_01544 [Roseovarius indicus]|uniref:Uncharacterized protein n=2 Tax=Roseovarius indicus TaxID=540747 RepID=A0A5P3ABT4_9RHOB|nr:hypothetical protein RIdsm_01544 [Roseovarius indicus]SFD99124.1 hypothetical protein SAMN04488031_1042 [Roseovarius indicus]